MKASFVDLRTKSRQIIEALKRNERITVFYRGRPAAEMRPIRSDSAVPSASEHPAFGLWADRDDMRDVTEFVRTLRKGRFDGL